MEEKFHTRPFIFPQKSGIISHNEYFTIREINKAIASFSNEYEIPFSMHIAGYKHYEISSYMNIPVTEVKSRITFVQEKLYNILESLK